MPWTTFIEHLLETFCIITNDAASSGVLSLWSSSDVGFVIFSLQSMWSCSDGGIVILSLQSMAASQRGKQAARVGQLCYSACNARLAAYFLPPPATRINRFF